MFNTVSVNRKQRDSYRADPSVPSTHTHSLTHTHTLSHTHTHTHTHTQAHTGTHTHTHTELPIGWIEKPGVFE